MRNRALHDALRDFALEAAALLVRVNEDEHELGFSLDEQSGGGGTLYRYRPLTEEFIAARWPLLRALPAFEPAARALGTGARAYLRRRGEPGADAEPALRAMLERLYEDSTSFAFPEERFERAYAGVERALYAGLMRATVAAPVYGVRLETARVELADDLMLADPALLTPAPSLPWSEDEEEGDRAASAVYVVLDRDITSDAPLPLPEARLRFTTALSALRLLDMGGLALAPLGFARAGDGAWQAFTISSGEAARGPGLTLGSDEAWELRRLVEALEEHPQPSLFSWALRRHELGRARPSEAEALSDHLLALRALLGGPGSDPATVALRLAALRADDPDRRSLQRRVEAAFTLEPFMVEGGLAAARGQRYVDTVGGHGPYALVRELEEHLRGLLAEVLGGELGADLASAADERLLRSSGPVEIRAERLAGRPPEAGEEDAGEKEAEAVESEVDRDGEAESVEEKEADDDGERSAPAAPLVAFPARPSHRRTPAGAPRHVDGGGDPPELDDAESYSAPV
jgi:hypothetical protein